MTIDYAKARAAMVEQQVRPWDVLDARVLETISRVPREAFVADARRALAYADLELPIGHGETMLKPVVEGRALQALKLEQGDEVLQIGTGSGYLAACLGHLARDVVSLERHADLADAARARLQAQGIANVEVVHADVFAWNTERRFDAICVGGAVDTVPARFLQWLRPGGRMFIVRGQAPAMEAVLVRREGEDVNAPRIESLFETGLAYLAGAAPVPHFSL
ncbi:protein-L-isoaspartate O-methyltransferase [Luteimonas sp. RC10]|uniref:protein-L-isoaspartate O-methyltransferase family protein n=1 Tax=Luteimonas sp. RC10 TaxID=2587035 RepID=UPI0016143EF9|nr:protein-L-isoaspartate O-methyltransferase [Luteimonas sp. RC10]MBB3342224.1 protein-L-isoaspartate(D-aspartate) O-methyltransferase [Luteimonas sp. RC10]